MVMQVMSLSRSGLSDFVLQRASAAILAIYSIWVMQFFLLAPSLDHDVLVTFFTSPVMQIGGTLAVLATVAHAWIGMWTIGTDYLRPAHVGALGAAPRRALALALAFAASIIGRIPLQLQDGGFGSYFGSKWVPNRPKSVPRAIRHVITGAAGL